MWIFVNLDSYSVEFSKCGFRKGGLVATHMKEELPKRLT